MTIEIDTIDELDKCAYEDMTHAVKERAIPCYKLICTSSKIMVQYPDIEPASENTDNMMPTMKSFDTDYYFDSVVQLVGERSEVIVISEGIM